MSNQRLWKRLKFYTLIALLLSLCGCESLCSANRRYPKEAEVDDWWDAEARAAEASAQAKMILSHGLKGGVYATPVSPQGTPGTPQGTPSNVNPADCTSALRQSIGEVMSHGPQPSENKARKSASATTNDPLVYFADLENNAMGVFDPVTHLFLAPVPVGQEPRGIAITPDGATILVANSASASISVINAASLTITATISLPTGSSPYGIAITPDGNRAYVANYLPSGSIFVIDIAGQSLVTTIPGGNSPIHVAISPDGALAYVTNLNDGTVSVIDTLTNQVNTTIPVPNADAITVSRNGRYIYVTNLVEAGTVTVLEAKTYTVVTTIPVGGLPLALALSQDGGFLFVANLDSAFISQIDAEHNTAMANLPAEKGIQTLTLVQP